MFSHRSPLRRVSAAVPRLAALWMGLAAGLGGWVLPATSQTLPLSEVTLDAQGRFEVRCAGDAAFYYLLRRSGSLEGPFLPAALSLGTPGSQTLTDPQPARSGGAFYRVERRALYAPLDTDGDTLDDVYELQHPRILNALDPADAEADADGDGAVHREEYRNQTDPETANEPVTRATFSPADGEDGVSVQRETIVRFSRPLAAGTVLTPAVLHAEFGGRRLLGRLELGTDRRLATLFHLEPLPGGARIRVTLDGNALADERGVAVDADADGHAGGVAVVDFETTANAALMGTAIQGRVLASETIAGSGADRPLAGVTITVDGHEESLRTVTDAEGRFVLEPCPAGEFFVHVDGRTSPQSQWPGGSYYPFVGKKWFAAAGRRDNRAPGNGDIFLPFIAGDTLQAVSATEPVRVQLPAAVLAANPELAGVEIQVPPNALFDPNGSRGGRVGIAPVPPDRLPEPLPPGLRFPVVITVQTDGPQNFDQPVPVRFPNLPDARTGLPLAPGETSALWSFNHDTGTWEIAGPMTVSADGRFVETDPGVGIRQPGWHGRDSASSLRRRKKKPCEDLKASDAWDIAKTGYDCLKNLSRAFQALGGVIDMLDGARKLGEGIKQLREDYAEGGVDPQTLKTSLEALAGYKNTVKNTYEALSASNPVSKAIEVGQCISSLARVGLDKLCANKDRACAGYWTRGLCNSLQPAIAAGDVLLQNMEKMDQDIRKAPLLALCSSFDLLAVSIGASASAPPGFGTLAARTGPDPQILALMDEIIRNGDRFVVLTESAPVALESLSEVEAWMRPVVEDTLSRVLTDAGALDNTAFAVELDGTVDQRGRLSAQGGLSLNVRPGVPYRILAYDPVQSALFISQGMTPRAGRQADLADFKLARLDEEPDADGDGLPDVVEAVVGSDPARADTDADGVSDFAEVRQGLDPLGGRLAETGIIATAATPGNAVDIAAANGLVVTANESGGVSVFSLSGGRSPIQIAQVAIPGSALRVALDDSRVAVAAGPGGLAVVDLSDPPAAGVARRIPLNGAVPAVAALAGLACAGTSSGEVALVDLAGGGIQSRLRLGSPVRDVAFGSRWVYALTDRHLYALDPADGTLSVLDSVTSPTPTGGHQRLFVGDTHAYAVHPRGCNIFDLSQPASPRLIAAGVTPQFGWKQMIPNGSGLGVAAVGRNRSLDGPHHVSVYDLRDPARPDVFLREIPTPGIARAVTVYDGRAYVADGPAGVQVIQYLPFDTQGRAPTIQLTTSHTPGLAEAGQVLRVRAQVTDDVQVAQVTFLLNGQPVFTDGNFPFEFSFVVGAPRLLNLDPFQLQATALDTGGNVARSQILNLRIVPDAQPPRVRRVAPFDGALTGTVPAVSAFLSEPADAATVNPASFRVWSSGPDEQWGTPDDLTHEGTYALHPDRNAIVFTPAAPLTTGDYRVRLADPLADSAGNRLETPWEFAFRVFGFRDEDGDGMPDELEPGLGLDPAQADSDGDGVLDGAEDFDRDGLPNTGEVFAQTDPAVADSDGDSLADGLEDPDGDVLSHAQEFAAGTNPLVADTDRDGWNDEAEVTAGSDPLNPRSRPVGFVLATPSLAVLLPAVVNDLSSGPGAGLHWARPPISVVLPDLAENSRLVAGSHLARPPVAVVVPGLAQGAAPLHPGGVVGGPPLHVTLSAPVTAAATTLFLDPGIPGLSKADVPEPVPSASR